MYPENASQMIERLRLCFRALPLALLLNHHAICMVGPSTLPCPTRSGDGHAASTHPHNAHARMVWHLVMRLKLLARSPTGRV